MPPETPTTQEVNFEDFDVPQDIKDIVLGDEIKSLQKFLKDQTEGRVVTEAKNDKLLALIYEALVQYKCRECGFEASRLDTQGEKSKNHSEGCSGLPNVIKEIKYIKGTTKVDQLHYKFLSKKRGFLVRQINLTKKLFLMDKVDPEAKDIAAEFLSDDESSTDGSCKS